MSEVKKPKSAFDLIAEGVKPEVDDANVASFVPGNLPAPATAGALQGHSVAPSAIAGVDSGVLGKLIQYLILKEGREAATAAQAEERRKQIQRQRDRNAKDQDSKILLKQARCRHLKGGRRGPKTQNKDYAVYQFQFIDFTSYIRCRICGMKWYEEDTVEHLVRVDKTGKKRKISNHTKIGWREANGMCDASTDTLSTSERIPNVRPNATNLDITGQQFETRLVDKDTGEVIEGVQL